MMGDLNDLRLDLPGIWPDAFIEDESARLSEDMLVLQGNRLGDTDESHIGVLLGRMRPPEGATIVDIGSGFGEPARLMHAARPDLTFIMANRSRAQLARSPAAEGLYPLHADMHRLPLPDNSMDGAMFLYSLCHADQGVALAEAARVVRPGGFCFVYDYERIGGNNRRMMQQLCARSYSASEFTRFANNAGWIVRWHENPGGDDTLFRTLFPDTDSYDQIFQSLRPVIWKLQR